jgi:glycerol kinase
MIGDSHAALLAHGIDRPGRVKATIGTGSSVMAATEGRPVSRHGLSATIAWSRGDKVQYALEGNISVSGHAAAFASDLLGRADEEALTELAAGVEDNGGIVFVPALAGLGAPHWRTEARGTITGLSLSTRPAHVARATLEAIALQIGDVVDAMEADLGIRLADLSIDGGAARNPLLVGIMADLLDRTIVRPRIAEASALGAACLAAEALGFWSSDGPVIAETVVPALDAERRAAIRQRWREAIAGATGWRDEN